MSERARLLLVFCFSLAVFLTFQNTPIFADPDSFYHAGAAKIMSEGVVVIDRFPYLPFSILADRYIDHHYLYHVFLIPFSLIHPLWGMKIATAVFGALFMTLFARILFYLKVPYPELFIALLLINRPFMFRANLAKASTLSLLFLFSGLFALMKKKHFLAFLIAFVYVWAYDGWILLLGLAILYWVTHTFGEMVYDKNQISPRPYFQTLFSRQEFLGPLAILGGFIAGVLLNPFFPKNLLFYYDHIVKIGIVGYRNMIGVGGEWYAYNPFLFLGNNALLMAVLVMAGVVYVALLRKQGSHALVFLFLAIVFLAATLRSQRNIEYLVPFLVLFIATASRWLSGEWVRQRLLRYQRKVQWLAVLYGIIFAVVFSISKDMILVRRELGNGFRLDFLQEESQWIVQNTKPNEIIFHSNWDEFPSLFFYNPSNYYIAGLDPSFMYARDKRKYFLWRDITQGKVTKNLQKIIKEEFGSTTVLASKNHQPLQRNLESNGFTMMYEGRDARIYQANTQ